MTNITALIIDFDKKCLALEAYAEQGSLWSSEALKVSQLLRNAQREEAPDIDGLLNILHRAQRVFQVHAAKLEHSTDFMTAVETTASKLWQDFGSPAVSTELQAVLADKLYNAKAGDRGVMLNLGDNAKTIGPILVNKCLEDNIPFDTVFASQNFGSQLLNHAEEAGIVDLAAAAVQQYVAVNKSIDVTSGRPENAVVEPDVQKSKIYAKAAEAIGTRRSSGDLFYTLTTIPTRKDAEIDQFNYQDILKIFFEMCDQPWDKIAQAHEALIAEFDAAREIHITNNDGTDVTMNIEGFTFCNSLIAKNVPGSEIFSGLTRDGEKGIKGTICAKGLFYPPGMGNKPIKNLTLEFDQGKIVKFEAEEGAEHFQEFLDRDPNNYYLGEIGIGTNPHLKKHLVNVLLVEKISGSFHVALGQSYQFKKYGGKPVHVDNGNRSKSHWDVTTMLFGKGGTIELDGRAVMKNGIWLDPQYEVLNKGWAVVPVNQRPDYWKAFNGYDANGQALWNNPLSAPLKPPAPTGN